MTYKIKKYGWIPDLPDQRDYIYSAPIEKLQRLPSRVDLRPTCPAVYDQGELGSCTANAIAGAMQFDEIKQKITPIFTPSRLFIYYNERAIEGTVNTDSGAMLRDGVKSVVKQGVCSEDLWPYNIANFSEQPPRDCYQAATQNKAILYKRLIRDLNQMKACLATGNPFVFGFTVYESFESPTVASTGHAPLPAPGEAVLGGHAVLAVGYDDASQCFIARNSWGTQWGLAGYFTLPYAYLTQPTLSSDFWTIETIH